jgi:L-amino acid N-acyltransferase YncA
MYGRMKLSGDLETVFDRSLWTLTDFLHFFKAECALVFCDDSNGIWFAAWMRQTRAAIVELSVWVRPECRYRKETLLAMETVCARALKLYATIIGLSRIELLSMHQRLGYRHVGTIAEGVELFALTAETFKPRLYREG